MKIVGLFILLVCCVVFASEDSFAKMKCKGDVYSQLDNGELVAQKIEFVPNNFQKVIANQKSDSPFIFKADKKSDEWSYVKIYNHEELLYARGYRNLIPEFYYDDLRLDRNSFVKFKENSVFGFNIVCRI